MLVTVVRFVVSLSFCFGCILARSFSLPPSFPNFSSFLCECACVRVGLFLSLIVEIENGAELEMEGEQRSYTGIKRDTFGGISALLQFYWICFVICSRVVLLLLLFFFFRFEIKTAIDNMHQGVWQRTSSQGSKWVVHSLAFYCIGGGVAALIILSSFAQNIVVCACACACGYVPCISVCAWREITLHISLYVQLKREGGGNSWKHTHICKLSCQWLVSWHCHLNVNVEIYMNIAHQPQPQQQQNNK